MTSSRLICCRRKHPSVTQTMSRFLGTLLSIAIATQTSFAQQGRIVNRVGDAFHGPIKQVRTETAQLKMDGDKRLEGPRFLIQLVNYSQDGLTKEVEVYFPNGSLRQKFVEKFLPSGNRESLSTYDANGQLLSKKVYEYDRFGTASSETRQNADGSVQSQTFVQSVQTPQGIKGISKITDGTTVETSVNTREEDSKTSKWTTTKPDGSRQENTFSVDSAGDHLDEQLTYRPDGSLALRRVSKVDRLATRLEATEYTGDGSIQKRTLETREYDEHRNLRKSVNYRWDAASQKFKPVAATYNVIEYF